MDEICPSLLMKSLFDDLWLCSLQRCWHIWYNHFTMVNSIRKYLFVSFHYRLRFRPSRLQGLTSIDTSGYLFGKKLISPVCFVEEESTQMIVDELKVKTGIKERQINFSNIRVYTKPEKWSRRNLAFHFDVSLFGLDSRFNFGLTLLMQKSQA